MSSQSSPDCAVIRKFTAQLRPAPTNGPSCCGFATEDVACSATGRVVNLTISGIGSFPTDLAVLTELRTFVVKDSLDLNGNMPSTFGSLKNLERLEIVNTHMAGPIPDMFEGMSRLRILNLRANALSGPVPDSLGKATELHVLDLSRNQLTSLPTSLTSLRSLRLVNLFDNHITSPFPLLPNVSSDCLTSGPHNRYLCLMGPASEHTGKCYGSDLANVPLCTISKDGTAVPAEPESNSWVVIVAVVSAVVGVVLLAVGVLVYRRRQGTRRRREFMRAIS